MTLQTERLRTVEQIRGFLDGNGEVGFTPLDRDEAYGFVRRTLVRLDYDALGRAGKGAVREFVGKATGLSRAQVTRLVGQYRATGRVEDRRAANSGRSFERVYTPADIRLLAEADEIGGQLCGPAACEVLRRQYEVFGDARFERLSRLSPSHLYNLRRSKTYRARRTTVDHTRPTTVRIGERRRPDPAGKPGYVRVDTVHQGDRNGVKGVYDINLVDEVTQFEHVGAVAGIAETFLVPVLEEMLVTLPFVVVGFHADNASRRDAPVPSTSTARSRRCSTSFTSRTSRSRGRGAPTTTPWSRARTPFLGSYGQRQFGLDQGTRLLSRSSTMDKSRSTDPTPSKLEGTPRRTDNQRSKPPQRLPRAPTPRRASRPPMSARTSPSAGPTIPRRPIPPYAAPSTWSTGATPGRARSSPLRFLILTAARSGEVRGAPWNEVDLDGELWTVPAARMKAGRRTGCR